MICLPNMTGKEMMAKAQGTALSILFARAYSIAPADQGLANSMDGFGAAGLPGWREAAEPSVIGSLRSVGERMGELKERRYTAMKKSSLRAQKVNRTFCTTDICQRSSSER